MSYKWAHLTKVESQLVDRCVPMASSPIGCVIQTLKLLGLVKGVWLVTLASPKITPGFISKHDVSDNVR